MPVQVGVGYIDIKPDLSGFSRDLKGRVDKDMGVAGSQAGKKFGSGFSSSIKGAVAGFAAAFTAVKVADFIGSAIGAASDLAESVSKSNQVFGTSAGIISAWAEGAASKIGLSKQAAFDAAGTFGNMFAQLGIGTDEAAALSIEMVDLAADFASFHNADITDVIAAQSSAFRGEYDALQRFLPTINAANVEQRALRMTGKATTKELTAQEKALAVNKLMMEGAGDATGDFARTSDGLANQQRVLSAEWANAKAELGEGLLPMMTSLAQFANDELVPAFKTLFTTGGDATGWAAQLRDAVGDVLGFMFAAFAELYRVVANLVSAIPGNWGEGMADNLRNAADGADDLRTSLHKSKEELLGAAGAGDELTKATKGAAVATVAFTKSVTGSNKAVRDAAASERDLSDAKKDLAELIKKGPVDEEKIAEARKSLADATRSAASADRDLADAQEDYDKAKAAADILGTDTAMEAAEDAADDLADATDSSASAHERAREAAEDLRKAQAGDPDFQDKLADARDRVADAQDKVAAAEQKTIDMAGGVVDATNKKTEAQRLLNVELEATKQYLFANPSPLGPNIAGPLAPNQIRLPVPAPLAPGVAGPLAPGQTQAAGPVQIDMTVLGPAPDPAILGKAIAWAL